jgi:3-dehydroshikimate dehydratase
MKIYMHVNYLEHQVPLKSIVRTAAEAGYQGIELRGWDISEQQPIEDYLPAACQLADHYGLDLVIARIVEAMDVDPTRRQKSLQEMLASIRIAGEHGIARINVFTGQLRAPGCEFFHFGRNGSAAAGEEHWRWAIEALDISAELAALYGIELCLETHSSYLHDLAESTVRLIEAIERPNLKVNFDYPNIHCHPANPGFDQSLSQVTGHIGYVHLKNLSVQFNEGLCSIKGTALREGQLNIPGLVKALLSAGYEGPFTLENIFEGDKQQMIFDDLAYLRSILNPTEIPGL